MDLKLSTIVGENFEICISEMSRKILLVTKKRLDFRTFRTFQTILGRKNRKTALFFSKNRKTE